MTTEYLQRASLSNASTPHSPCAELDKKCMIACCGSFRPKIVLRMITVSGPYPLQADSTSCTVINRVEGPNSVPVLDQFALWGLTCFDQFLFFFDRPRNGGSLFGWITKMKGFESWKFKLKASKPEKQPHPVKYNLISKRGRLKSGMELKQKLHSTCSNVEVSQLHRKQRTEG